MKSILIFGIISVLILSSCKNENPEPQKTVKLSSETTLSAGNPIISTKAPWIRPGAENRNTALFVNIKNDMDVMDTLYSVESDLAKVVEIHETYQDEKDMMGMRHIEFLEIIPNSTTELKPKSFHVMLIGLNKDLAVGDSGQVTLKFKISGDINVDAIVKDEM